jgi:hypothetical protein
MARLAATVVQPEPPLALKTPKSRPGERCCAGAGRRHPPPCPLHGGADRLLLQRLGDVVGHAGAHQRHQHLGAHPGGAGGDQLPLRLGVAQEGGEAHRELRVALHVQEHDVGVRVAQRLHLRVADVGEGRLDLHRHPPAAVGAGERVVHGGPHLAVGGDDGHGDRCFLRLLHHFTLPLG